MISETRKNYNKNHKEEIKQYDKKYKLKCKKEAKLYGKDWYIKNIVKVKQYSKDYNLDNKLVLNQKSKIYDDNHKKEKRDYYLQNKYIINSYINNWTKEKYKNDIGFRLSKVIKSYIWRSLKGQKDNKHWENLVGWKIQKLKQHIEKQFTVGMIWGNYGEWEIDHIIPISSFNIINYICDDFKRCWSLDNLQPLWATTRIIDGIEYLGNRNKSDKIINYDNQNKGSSGSKA